MRLNTILTAAAFVLVCCAGTMAQTQPHGPVFPPCQQAMLKGDWELSLVVVVGTADVLNELQPWESNPVCPITTAANGSFATVGSCLSATLPVTTSPSGALTIDSSCHVTGSLAYTVSDFGFPPLSFKLKTSAWISADGSRVSGYVTGTATQSGSPSFSTGGTIEVVYRTAGQ